MTITATEIVTARAALGWSRVKLSVTAQVRPTLLKLIESGSRPGAQMALDRIQRALELGRANYASPTMTPAQLRAARALIAWSQFKLAREAKVDLLLIRLYEQSRGQYRAEVLRMLRTALESAGVVFVEENGDGPGVRLRKAARA